AGHCSSAKHAEVPIVLNKSGLDRLVIGMTFNHKLYVGVCFDYICNFTQNFFSLVCYLIFTALKKHFIGKIDKYSTSIHSNINVLVIYIRQRTLKVGDKPEDQGILFCSCLCEITYV